VEQRLRELEAVQQQYAEARRQRRVELTEQDRGRIRELSRDLLYKLIVDLVFSNVYRYLDLYEIYNKNVPNEISIKQVILAHLLEIRAIQTLALIGLSSSRLRK